MEAALLAASAAAAAAKEAALAASVAAAAAVKDAATAKEAVAGASASALCATEAAAAAASASALCATEAAAAAASAGEAAATAVAAVVAAMRASKKRKFHPVDDDGDKDPDPLGSEDVDFTSRLPDDLLGSIVSLLHTKDGVRTQAISSRWRPLWRSAPLNLVADGELTSKGHKTIDLIPKILSQHPGPARRFSVKLCCISDWSDNIEAWLSSQALDSLQELELTCYYQMKPPLPSSAFRFAPTLRVAEFCNLHFPDLIMQLSLKFPCLKKLTLHHVSISEDALHSMISRCAALESLVLKQNVGIARLCISSKTLKSLGLRNDLQELVIEDAPCLERLLGPGFARVTTIRVISAPTLKVLGVFSEHIAQLQFGTTVFQKMIAVSLTTKMHTVRDLVLESAGPNLDTVVNFLKCFPCLERLYVIFGLRLRTDDVPTYVPLDPLECLEFHLKEVVLKNYDGTKSPSIDFTKFFVLNAKVLKEMKITLPYHRNRKWFAKQHKMLQIKNRASGDARIELKCGTYFYGILHGHEHDLSVADPFDMPSGQCSECCCVPF